MSKISSFFFALLFVFSAATAHAATTTLHTFPAVATPEQLAFNKNDGTIWVSFVLNVPGVTQGLQHLDATGTTVLATYPFPSGTIQGGGLIYNSNTNLLYFSIIGTGAANGVWVLDPATGVETQYAYVPQLAGVYSSPNGITPDLDGNIFIADSGLGKIWVAPVHNPADPVVTAVTFIDLGTPAVPPIPGPNGLRFGPNGHLFCSVSVWNSVYEIPVSYDALGNPVAGTATTFVTLILPLGGFFTPGDFIFDVMGNMYITTEIGDAVLKITPSKVVSLITHTTSGGLGHNLTAAMFGVLPGDTKTLYLTNSSFPVTLGLDGKLLKVSVPMPYDGIATTDW